MAKAAGRTRSLETRRVMKVGHVGRWTRFENVMKAKPKGYWNGREILPYPIEAGCWKTRHQPPASLASQTNNGFPTTSSLSRSDASSEPSSSASRPVPVIRIGVPAHCLEGPQVHVEGGQIRLDELPAYLSRVLGFPDYGAMPMVHRPEKIDATTPAGAIPYPPVAQAHVASFHGNDQTLVNRAKNQYQHESTFSEQKACRKGCHSGFGVLVQDLSLGASGEDVEHVFGKYGEILATVFTNLNWSASKKEMLILYSDPSAVGKALSAMDGIAADGKPIIVKAVDKENFGGRWPRQEVCDACRT